MKLEKIDFYFALLIFFFGLYTIYTSIGYGLFAGSIAGSGLFSFVGGSLFLLGSAGTIVSKIRKQRMLEGVMERREILSVSAMVVTTIIFIQLVEIVGFIVLTPVYVFLIASIIQLPKTLKNLSIHLTVALGFTWIAYQLFGILLEIPLPPGWLG